MKLVTRIVSWLLFIVSASLFLLAVYNAAMGRLLDLTALEINGIEPGALIVAGVVTITWINGGLMLRYQVIENVLEWKVTRALTVLAFLVDVAIMLALIVRFRVPPLLPLFVAMGHAGAHVSIWLAASNEVEKRPGGLLSGDYQSKDAHIAALETQLQLQLQAQKFAEQSHSDRIAIAEPLLVVGICPDCEMEISGKGSKGLQNAMNAHRRWCKNRAPAHSNGHHQKEHA